MQVYRLRVGVTLRQSQPVACIIGNFDGVHLGHQHLVGELVCRAKSLGLASAVMLFEPQPLELFRPNCAPRRLMSWREKAHTLSQLGVDVLYLVKFDSSVSSLEPRQFVESLLIGQCKVRHIIVGDDFRFGRNRGGGVAELKRYGEPLGLSVDQAKTFVLDGKRVSSTRVRQVLEAGDCLKAKALLGRAFEIAGKVVYGDGLGARLGFPTANIKLIQPGLPVRGVFAVSVTDESNHSFFQAPAVANLGSRPTVSGAQWRFEVHLLGTNGVNLYGKRLRARLEKKLRDERAFESLDLLKQAISKDTLEATRFFEKRSQTT